MSSLWASHYSMSDYQEQGINISPLWRTGNNVWRTIKPILHGKKCSNGREAWSFSKLKKKESYFHLKKKKLANVFTQSDLFSKHVLHCKVHLNIKYNYEKKPKHKEFWTRYFAFILWNSCLYLPVTVNCVFSWTWKKMHKIQRGAIPPHEEHMNMHCHLLTAVVYMGKSFWEIIPAKPTALTTVQLRSCKHWQSSVVFISFCIFPNIY